MINQRLQLFVWLRLVLMLATLLVLVKAMGSGNWLTSSLIFLALGLQVYSLNRWLLRTNHEIARFLEAIRHQDFSQNFSTVQAPRAWRQLYKEFGQVMDDFKNMRAEKEAHSQFLRTVLDFMDAGVLCYKTTGEVVLHNQAFGRHCGVPHLSRMDTLERREPLLAQRLRVLRGGQFEVIGAQSTGSRLLVTVNHFRLLQDDYTIATFKEIDRLVDHTQTEAWIKLMRVLTHEIMNSMTPIVSLAQTLGQGLAEHVPHEQLLPGAQAIGKRSEGLLKFVQVYRHINQQPKARMQNLEVAQLLDSLRVLMEPEMERQAIHFIVDTKTPYLRINADQQLIEQVLINLIKNAIHAVHDADVPTITVVARALEQQVIIDVSDNGCGIEPALISDIFVPFFTTRQGGSGVGLTLSRQIMQLHHGTITVTSQPDMGSTFRLSFPEWERRDEE